MRADDSGSEPQTEAELFASGSTELDDDFDFESKIDEMDADLPAKERRDAALAEFGLSLPALVLLVLSALLLGANRFLGPGWLGAAMRSAQQSGQS
jgi:hypothetical protein